MADRSIKQSFLDNLYLAFRGHGLREHTFDAEGQLVQDAVTGTFSDETRSGELTFVFKETIDHPPITQPFEYPYESVSGFKSKLYQTGGEIVRILNEKYTREDYDKFYDEVTE